MRLLRPAQAFKAAIVFLPALFNGQGSLQRHGVGLHLTACTWIIASGCVYIFNDLWDLPRDLQREDRRHRPLVRGDVSKVQAWLVLGGMLVLLGILLAYRPSSLALYISIYLVLNLAYTLRLKRVQGLRQAIVALGFWFRLKSGAEPIYPIPLTPWGSIFTLSLAYYLNCLKGDLSKSENPIPAWAGALLAGSLTLTALCSLCIHRALLGSLNHPEFPPLLCLIGMHRVALASSRGDGRKEQASLFFKDWVVVGCEITFLALMVGMP